MELCYLLGESYGDIGVEEVICWELLEDIILTTCDVCGDFAAQLPNIYSYVKSIITRNDQKKVDMKWVYSMLTSEIMDKIRSQITVDKIDIIVDKIKENQEILDSIGNENEDNMVKMFKTKIKIARHYITKYAQKKTIRMLALGGTQCGKTALVKKLFNLNDDTLKMRGGLESDTSHIQTYHGQINGIDVEYVDSPGFFDTRGEDQDAQNMAEICGFIRQNEIDVIMWVFKTDDVLDLKQKKRLKKLTKEFGDAVWKKSLIVLTHANNLPPDEYYDDSDDVTDVDAWTKYINKKTIDWQTKIKAISKTEINVPIVFSENNSRMLTKIDGVSTLRDGRPIYETIMIEIFKLLDNIKSLNMFVAIGGAVGSAADALISPFSSYNGSRASSSNDLYGFPPSDPSGIELDNMDSIPLLGPSSPMMNENEISLARTASKPNFIIRFFMWIRSLFTRVNRPDERSLVC